MAYTCEICLETNDSCVCEEYSFYKLLYGRIKNIQPYNSIHIKLEHGYYATITHKGNYYQISEQNDGKLSNIGIFNLFNVNKVIQLIERIY